MKQKPGRVYLELEQCIASVDDRGVTRLSTMSSTIEISEKEFEFLYKWVKTRLKNIREEK